MKPGLKTSEFWFSLAAAVVGVLLTSGVFGSGTPAEQVAGIIAAGLAAAGYSVSRGAVKAANQVSPSGEKIDFVPMLNPNGEGGPQ